MQHLRSFLLLSTLAILVAGCARTQPRQNPPTPAATPTVLTSPANTATAPARVGKNLIYVADQKPGISVTVTEVGLQRPGYAVIHRAEGEKPGAIVGTSMLLAAGASSNVAVPLTQPAADGQSFFAMLHRDDGDRQFDATIDSPVSDESGNVMMMEFSVSEDASVPGPIQF